MTAYKVGASISIPDAIDILQNFNPKTDISTDTRISNPRGGNSYLFYTPVYDHNISDWYNDGYSWKNHGSNKLPNKINPRIVVSYHRAIPPKNFVATNGVKWFKKRMCYLVGQKCPILISYSGNEQPFRSNTTNDFSSEFNADHKKNSIDYGHARNLSRKQYLQDTENENNNYPMLNMAKRSSTGMIRKETFYDTPANQTTSLTNKHLRAATTNGNWIKPKYSCPCGSTEHSRTTHKTCPLNSKIISMIDTEKEQRRIENASQSYVSTCRCGSTWHTRITNNNCPLNPKNKNTAMERIHQNILPTSPLNKLYSHPLKINYTENETRSEYPYQQDNFNINQSDEFPDNFEETFYNESEDIEVMSPTEQTSSQETENYSSHNNKPQSIEEAPNPAKRRRKMLNPRKLY